VAILVRHARAPSQDVEIAVEHAMMHSDRHSDPEPSPYRGETTGSDERPAQVLAGAVLRFDLPAELAQLQTEPTWEFSDRNAITLVKEGDLRLTLTRLKDGARMDEHRTDGFSCVQVLEGRLRVVVAGVAHDLGPGEVIALGRQVPHEVTALEDAAFLLTIALPGAPSLA
jgi:quercetin dioxygenase-like cupin family protein